MKVNELSISDVRMCSPSDTLETAAMIMWDNDCGCVPVVNEQLRVIGVITDRDICMGAYTQGVALKHSLVSSAMSKQAFTCRLDDDLATAEQIMRQNRVRRLPVVDAKGKLAGVISLNDIAREAERERAMKAGRQVSDAEVAQLLAAICEPRRPSLMAQAA